FLLWVFQIFIEAEYVRGSHRAQAGAGAVERGVEIAGGMNIPLAADFAPCRKERPTQADKPGYIGFHASQPHFVAHIGALAGNGVVLADETILARHRADT